VSARQLPATGQQRPLPQQARSEAQVTRKGTHWPSSHRSPSHGSSLAGEQSASARQPLGSPAGQHSPLPQQVVPGMQLTMKKVQKPSTHAAPVHGSASPSLQSASWAHVICSAVVCAAIVLPRLSQEPVITPAPIRRRTPRRSVGFDQIRAMRSNAFPFISTLRHIARLLLLATRRTTGAFRDRSEKREGCQSTPLFV